MNVPADSDAFARRLQLLQARIEGSELDVLLLAEAVELRYITGYTGSNGLALVPNAGGRGVSGGRAQFVTDFRYEAQSAAEVAPAFERSIVTGELGNSLPALLDGERGRLGFDASKLSVKAHDRLRGLLPGGWELVKADGLVDGLRLVKEPGEIALIAAASVLADEALQGVLETGLAGRTEREVAFELETAMRRLGAEALSFPSIVASGAHGALPHAQPRDVEIAPDVLVTIDWGAMLDGYCSDCTRTYATGEGIGEQPREIYALVLEAQLAGLAAVQSGPNGREVDAAARDVIDRAGQGENFGHGLGHGVGLEVHEGPRLSRTAGDEPLEDGNVVTVEPGVYLPGRLGVRIEDLTVVRDGGRDVLTGLSKDLTVIS
ncbi:MAG TPA: Xaa-Pro peptidase family protein [Solirubrobacteraceae bacterium]